MNSDDIMLSIISCVGILALAAVILCGVLTGKGCNYEANKTVRECLEQGNPPLECEDVGFGG